VTVAQFSALPALKSYSRALLPIKVPHCASEINVMARSVKAVATLASLAVLACSILAFSWVGLALLGY
jgi:hypothetical protein